MDLVYFRRGYTLDSVESILRATLSFKEPLRLNKLELNTVRRHLSGLLDLLPTVLTQNHGRATTPVNPAFIKTGRGIERVLFR